MVFYSLANGAQTSAPNNDWHIAFSVRHVQPPFNTYLGVAIRINEAYGLQLYLCPNQKLSQFSTFDTTGWQSWTRFHNPDTTWTFGAFNANTNFSDPYNYGWGEYSLSDHNVNTDSAIYLIVMPDGSFKKFAMQALIYDTVYDFQYANLDNSGLTNQQVLKNPYPTKSFVYYNLLTNSVLDKEPALANWDLVALRYNNTSYNPANLSQDIGILTNDANSAYAASGTAAQQSCYTGSGFSNHINVIGKSWMGAPGDTVIPGLAYFIQTASSGYKLTVTAFGGAATGVVAFTLSTCASQTGISEVSSANIQADVYPIPASDGINVTVNSTEDANAGIKLIDMTGRTIISENMILSPGTNTLGLNTADIQPGNYILSISTPACGVNKLISIVK